MHFRIRSSFSLTILVAALACSCGSASESASSHHQERSVTPRHYTLAEDGAWCWFSDPRAIILDGQLYAGWMSSDGSVQIGQWDPSQPAKPAEIANLAPQFERDDHDHPTLLALPDNRLAAFYAPHAWGDIHLRKTVDPASVESWTSDRTLDFDMFGGGRRGVTYTNPILLSQENNTLYLFWRGTHFKPSFATSKDFGETWSEPLTLIEASGSDDHVRPYVKYNSDGKSRIDFLFTDGHPRDEPQNSVYYLRYENGAFTKADGSHVGTLADLPFAPEQCDLVYDGARSGRAWVWDIASDSQGKPVVAYTRHPSEEDHRYHYARWDGERWQDNEICPAGKWFPETPPGEVEREPHYSGGLSLDPVDPSNVYTARPIEGVFEIERWTTSDGGDSWTTRPITKDSAHNNVRPHVARAGADSPPIVIWMHTHGGYRHYLDYHTALHGAIVTD